MQIGLSTRVCVCATSQEVVRAGKDMPKTKAATFVGQKQKIETRIRRKCATTKSNAKQKSSVPLLTTNKSVSQQCTARTWHKSININTLIFERVACKLGQHAKVEPKTNDLLAKQNELLINSLPWHFMATVLPHPPPS